MDISGIKLRTLLFMSAQLMQQTARSSQSFKKRLGEKNFIAQIKVMDNSIGRYFIFKDGKVSSKSVSMPTLSLRRIPG